MSSDTYSILKKLHPFQALAMEKKGFSLRKQVDLSNKCNDRINSHKNDHINLTCKGYCLYDIEKDPCETKNIAKEHQGIVKLLKEKLHKYWKELIPQAQDCTGCKEIDPTNCHGSWYPWQDGRVHCAHPEFRNTPKI